MGRKRPGRWCVALLLVAAIGGCSSKKVTSDRVQAATPTTSQAATAGLISPQPAALFRPTVEPSGFRLALAGQGGYLTELSSDSVGTVKPMIVLADPRLADPLVGPVYTVAAVRYDGLQGGLAQASRGYVGSSRPRQVGAKQALFTPPGVRRDGIRVPIDLIVDFGDGWAVRVGGTRKAREADLVEIATLATLDLDHLPVVAHPPSGLAVVARLTADQVAATKEEKIAAPHGLIPGPPSAYSIGYSDRRSVGSPAGSVVFMSLPGSASDLLAVKVLREADGDGSEPVIVNGTSGWLITRRYSPTTISRSLVFVGPSGNLFVVSASGETDRTPDLAALERLAAGVRPATAAEWQTLVSRVPR